MDKITPRQALLLSLCAALTTMGMKAGAWWLTGSVGYLSDALESLVNLAGAVFALGMVTYAMQPADAEHPFGHGKAEYFSVAFEGGMIFLAALAILVASGQRLLHPQALEGLGWGTVLSVLASLINLLVARILLAVGRAHRSVALEADARHLMTDVWTTAGVVLGVGLAAWSGLSWLDPLVAGAVALNILREGWQLLRRSADGLMDRSLDDESLGRLVAILEERTPGGCAFANLRTRAAGAHRFAQVDLRVPAGWSVGRAHDLADAVEQAVAQSGITLTTHVEPMPPGGSGLERPLSG
jgi:cation diffusion facilitator family transporter